MCRACPSMLRCRMWTSTNYTRVSFFDIIFFIQVYLSVFSCCLSWDLEVVFLLYIP